MNTDQILKVLKNERECIKRQTRSLGDKPRCMKDADGVKLCELCDLCLPDDEILEVYDFLINGYELLQNEGAESYTIKCKEPLSEEQIAHLKNEYERTICQATITALPDNFKAIILGEEKGDSE